MALQTNLIKESIDKGSIVKVYFKDVTRSPMIGKFVSINGDDIKEGYVRFVHSSRIQFFDVSKTVNFTRLHLISNFQFIQPV